MEDKGAGALGEEGGDPVDHVGGDVLIEEERPEFGSIDIVKTSFNVEEKGRDRPTRALKGADLMNQGRAGVRGAESGEGAALIWVKEAGLAGHFGESDCHDPLQYLGDSFEEDDYAEGCWCVVGRFAWLVQNYPFSMFEAGWVVAQGDERGE